MSAGESILRYDADGMPHIIHDHGRRHEVCDALEKVLSEDGCVHGGGNLFWRAGQPVKVISQKLPSKCGIARPDGALVVHPVSAAHLQEIAGWAATHWKVERQGRASPNRLPPLDGGDVSGPRPLPPPAAAGVIP